MKQANEFKVFTHFSEREMVFEKVDSKPCETFIPGQSVRLSELVARFDRGQRLNIPTRPSNWVEEGVPDESFTDAPPDNINDIVDVDAYKCELSERKNALKEKYQKKKKEQTPQKPSEPPQAPIEAQPGE